MTRRRTIEEELRNRIQDGRFPRGAKIPTRRQLMADLCVSSTTLQRAFDRLTEQGYLVSKGKLGTFTTAVSPDRGCCALVFGDEPGEHGWNRLWTTVLREGSAWKDAKGRYYEPYFIKDLSVRSPDHLRLCRDLAEGGVAGMLFVSDFTLPDSPIFTSPIPRVVIAASDQKPGKKRSILRFAHGGPHLLRRFAGLGRNRVAAICSPGTAAESKLYIDEARRLGLSSRPEWWLGMSTMPSLAECARRVAHLLLSGDPQTRPDCLLIDDDNLVPHATAGIVDAGINVPADLDILAHANFPHPTLAAVPCQRYGTDLRHMLTAAWEQIDRMHAGLPGQSVAVPEAFTPCGSDAGPRRDVRNRA